MPRGGPLRVMTSNESLATRDLADDSPEYARNECVSFGRRTPYAHDVRVLLVLVLLTGCERVFEIEAHYCTDRAPTDVLFCADFEGNEPFLGFVLVDSDRGGLYAVRDDVGDSSAAQLYGAAEVGDARIAPVAPLGATFVLAVDALIQSGDPMGFTKLVTLTFGDEEPERIRSFFVSTRGLVRAQFGPIGASSQLDLMNVEIPVDRSFAFALRVDTKTSTVVAVIDGVTQTATSTREFASGAPQIRLGPHDPSTPLARTFVITLDDLTIRPKRAHVSTGGSCALCEDTCRAVVPAAFDLVFCRIGPCVRARTFA